MATTPAGWPYVQPADHPLEYPAVSQSLANKLESLGLRHAWAQKGSTANSLASGAASGFTATLTGVRVGALVVGIITQIGAVQSGAVPAQQYLAPVPTGATLPASYGHQLMTAPTLNLIQPQIVVVPLVATAATVTLTYSVTLASGTWSATSSSSILLVVV